MMMMMMMMMMIMMIMMMMMALFCLFKRTPLLTHFLAHSSNIAHNQVLEHFD